MSQLEPSPSTTSTFGQTWINWLAKVYRYFAVPGTAEPEKAVVLDANGKIDALDITTLSLNGTAVTATAAELNYNDLTTGPGTAEASKSLVLDANKDISGIRYISFGGQLAFPATQAASSNANTLDDYEEGAWTPIITDGTNNASTYSAQTGRYAKIGDNVYIKGFVVTSNLGSVTGSIYISGLPFTSNSTSAEYSAVSVTHGLGYAVAAGQSVGGFIVPNQSRIELWLWDDVGGQSPMLATEWTADGRAIFSVWYRT